MNCGFRIVDCGLNTEFQRDHPACDPAASWAPLVQTEPIRGDAAGDRAWGRGAWAVYKQTQFGGGAYRAKRSQFPTAGIPHHSTILSFHHSNPMPIVRNEPNFARTDRNGRAPLGSSVRNKANVPGTGRVKRGDCS